MISVSSKLRNHKLLKGAPSGSSFNGRDYGMHDEVVWSFLCIRHVIQQQHSSDHHLHIQFPQVKKNRPRPKTWCITGSSIISVTWSFIAWVVECHALCACACVCVCARDGHANNHGAKRICFSTGILQQESINTLVKSCQVETEVNTSLKNAFPNIFMSCASKGFSTIRWSCTWHKRSNVRTATDMCYMCMCAFCVKMLCCNTFSHAKCCRTVSHTCRHDQISAFSALCICIFLSIIYTLMQARFAYMCTCERTRLQ